VSTTDDLLAANARYAQGLHHGGLPAPPARRAAIVTCMDARMDVYAILGLAPGDCHVIRNAGGVVTDDAIRSLTISQRLLGTEEIVVIHHTGCGMLGVDDDAFRASIESDTGIRPPWSAEAFTDLDAEARQSLARLRRSPFLPHGDRARAFVYDVETGRLREVT
jgi:carbonic anhydrase